MYMPTTKKIEGFYKADNFIDDIAFGAFLLVFCDLNTYWDGFVIMLLQTDVHFDVNS